MPLKGVLSMASSVIPNNRIRIKYFCVTKNQSFVANTVYEFSKSDFGMGDITPLGFAMIEIFGNYNREYQSILSYSSNVGIIYKSTVSNSDYVTFRGVVFY